VYDIDFDRDIRWRFAYRVDRDYSVEGFRPHWAHGVAEAAAVHGPRLATLLGRQLTGYTVAWYTPMAFLPNSATDVVTQTVFLDYMVLSNTTAGALTVVLKDKTTNCNGAACQFWPTVSIAANSTSTVNFGGIIVTSGLQWQASATNSVVGELVGAYTKP